MASNQVYEHWIPTNLHGVIPLPADGKIEEAIRKAIRKSAPNWGSFTDIQWLLHTNADNSQSVVFEVIE